MSISTSPKSAAILVAVLLALPAFAAPSRKDAKPPKDEGDLARRTDLYLVVDRAASTLEIKARGLVLEAVPLTAASFLGYQPARGEGALPAVALPAIWTVSEAPPAPHRTRIAPETLTEEGVESVAALAPAASGAPAMAASGTPTVTTAAPEPPDAYDVPLEGGWTLAVGASADPPGRLARWEQAFSDGWLTLRGRPPERPPRLALGLDPVAARGLHHLFRPGLRVLVR